ncbi:unnamed protein product [Blepharisma stoltei]|uniref:Seipin n=1 Tax=Blepharisma stoltei TaxID=1481888 RepID=A0AAU9IE73_9CILI|nr:unnamed protein product [Blepharisma stoltei]
MEYERSLFRIYDIALNNPRFILFIKIFSIFCISLSIFNLTLFLIFHCLYINNGEALADAFSSQLLSGCGIYQSPELNLTLPLEDECLYINNSTVLLPEDIYHISVNSLTYEFSMMTESLYFPEELVKRKNFTVHNITANELVSDSLWIISLAVNEIDTVMINQLKTVFHSNGMLRNLKTKEIWIWSESQIKEKENLGFFGKLRNLCKAFFWFSIVSLITGLTCRFAIIGSSALLLAIVSLPCINRVHPQCSHIAYLSFPWIGEPAYALSQARKSTFKLLFSFFLMLFVLYMMYICTSILWTFYLFENCFPQDIDERFYNLVSFVEFFSLIFTRTKKSVAYYPRFISFFLISFLLYRYNYFYGFLNLVFAIVSSLCFGIMGIMIVKWEVPTMNDGPSFASPRLVYQMVFNERRTGLADLWSMFYPVEGRGYFTDREMERIFPQQNV